MHWVKATDATSGKEVWLNIALARTVVGLPEGTVVEFDDIDAITVREEPEKLLAVKNAAPLAPP